MKTNETQNQSSVTNLTPAELELIRIKREEEKLAAEKKLVERKAEEEKKIVDTKALMLKTAKSADKLNIAAEELFLELNKLAKGQYELVEVPNTETFKAYHYNILTEEERKAGKSNEEIYFQEDMEYILKHVMHTNSGATIRPKHYYTSSGSYSTRSEYAGIRYNLSLEGVYDRKNESLKSAKTINEKIQNKFIGDVNKAKAAQEKKSMKQWTVDTLNVMYPRAEVKAEQESGRYPYNGRGRYEEGREYVKVSFPNNFVLNYSWNTNSKNEKELVLLGINVNGLSEADKKVVIKMFAK